MAEHRGCATHRLESKAGNVFSDKATSECLTRCRKAVTRYTNFSQASTKLATYCKAQEPPILNAKVTHDVSPRWLSTHDMGDRRVTLEPAIRAHERADELEPMLISLDWAMLPGIVSLLKPPIYLQSQLCFGGLVERDKQLACGPHP